MTEPERALKVVGPAAPVTEPPALADRLAAPQAALFKAWKDQGLDPDSIGGRLAEIIKNGDPEVALKAMDIYIKATIGFAPTNSRSINLHAHSKGSDRFFDEAKFTNTPPPKTD